MELLAKLLCSIAGACIGVTIAFYQEYREWEGFNTKLIVVAVLLIAIAIFL
jgi:hypothetical protein